MGGWVWWDWGMGCGVNVGGMQCEIEIGRSDIRIPPSRYQMAGSGQELVRVLIHTKV